MVLEQVYNLSKQILPPQYYPHAAVSSAVLLVTYAFAQGRTTNRERDLHARTFIVTGAFTPLGITLITALASRGAHIIALSQYPLEHPQPALLIPLLRSTTNNQNIYADYANLSSPESIRTFCSKFLTEGDQRLDGIVFAHEYHGIGSRLGTKKFMEQRREEASIASFLIMTLLLPALLVAPIERDIRIVSVINPFYAAALPSFSKQLANEFAAEPQAPSLEAQGIFLAEGHRALRTAVFARHLQRVLDALPNRGPTLDGKKNTKDTTARQQIKPKHSNIISISVCPGISRADTVAPLLNADREAASSSWRGLLLYFLLYPLLWLLAKSPTAALQSVLHVLFFPTPFKRALAQVTAATDPSAQESTPKPDIDDKMPEEVLKPGALYRECMVVTLQVPLLPEDFLKAKDEEEQKRKSSKKTKDEEVVELDDDGEFGGEIVGRTVWEWYEMKLKEWEAREKASKPAEKDCKSEDKVQPSDTSKPSEASTSS